MNISGVSFKGAPPIVSCKNIAQADRLTKAINKISGNIEAIKRNGKDVLIIESTKGANSKKVIRCLEDCIDGPDRSGRGRAAEAYYKSYNYKQVYDKQLPKNVNVYR